MSSAVPYVYTHNYVVGLGTALQAARSRVGFRKWSLVVCIDFILSASLWP